METLKTGFSRDVAHLFIDYQDSPYWWQTKELGFLMSRVVRKPAFCICKNKDADQLRGNCEADQRLCFGYIYSTIPLFSKYEISSL